MKQRFANRVEVYVDLANGAGWSGAWLTPVSFGRCLSKGSAWAKHEMQKKKINGRSSIRKIEVTVTRTSTAF